MKTRCVVCKQPWTRWARRLGDENRDRHVKCLKTHAEQDALLAEFEADPRLTERAFAERLGVPWTHVRTWIEHARRRRMVRAVRVTR